MLNRLARTTVLKCLSAEVLHGDRRAAEDEAALGDEGRRLAWPRLQLVPPGGSAERTPRAAQRTSGGGVREGEPERAGGEETQPPAPGHGAIRTLLVEDDPNVRGLLETVLTMRGHQVVAYGDGEQAWLAHQRGGFALIVLDWMLPGLDGLELCRRIRTAPGGDRPVIMAVTARDRPQDLRAMLQAGADDYLAKPFEMTALEVRLAVAERQALAAMERHRNELLEHDRNRVLELIARNEPLDAILGRLAELVERQRTGLSCAVLVTRDGALYHEAAPSLPERYVEALDGLPVGPAATALGAAVHHAEPVLTTDLATDPLWVGYRQLALRNGLRACWAVPIRGGGRALGVVALYAGQPRQATPIDLGLLDAASRLAGLAIEHARLFDEAAMVEALRGLSRLKSEFLSTVSHELRTPLSLIYGYAELLKVRAERLSAGQVEDMATEIHTSSGTMIRLVDDLLDFARIEQGRLRLELRRTEVSELLRGLIETFRHQPGGEQLAADLPPPFEASVDPERLTQVVGNLLTNALRYAPDGPIVLRAVRQKGALRVEVVDHGPGVPPDEQSRVWEKFYRGSLAMSASSRGSGLGLAVVKHLVELQGGRVGLTSEPGRGSTFWFTLPVGVESGS